MKQEHYTQVAYIGVLNDDDTLKIGIPLYVKVTADMSAEQEKHIHEIAALMIRRYEKQISDYFANQKKEQQKNEKIV